MANHHLSDVVSGFYNELNVKLNFKTRVNAENLSGTVNDIIDQLSEETMKRYYGSGLLIPENLEGARVIDLGCGSGSLVFILSKLVGATGYVVGVDITSGLIDGAEQESEYHWKKWGYDKSNFEFFCENVERVTELGLPEESFDIVISNGVFCVCPDKDKVFQQAFRMLKPNGVFLLGDVYGEVKQPDELKNDEKLWCLGATGAMLWNELSSKAQSHGFTVPHLLAAGYVDIKKEELKKILSNAQYLCAEWRLFKLAAGVKRGPATVTYMGNIPDNPDSLRWDIDLEFKKGHPVVVDGDLATILSATYFSKNFRIADCSEKAETKKNQNPYQLLKDLEAQGKLPPPRYAVE